MTQLPRVVLPATSFVGRERELRELARLLEEPGIITILGPPGIGKTRVALEYVRNSRDGWSQGALVADATEASSSDELCALVARILDTPVHDAADRSLAQLGAALRARGDVLLVLDNVEQLAPIVRSAFEIWSRLAPQARLVATSRERLRAAGERVLELGSLSLPDSPESIDRSDAVALFVERARSVAHGYAVEAHDTAVVVELLHALDGLPLAIELAATRMRVVSPAQLLSLLSRRFEVLGGTVVHEPGRTLRGALETSWQLLTEWEKTTLAQLSVFRGGFDLEAAEAVVATRGEPSVLDLLQGLRDRSLLRAEPEPTEPTLMRFGLYLTIRDFAAEQLSALGGVEETRTRHARYYSELARALVSELRRGDRPHDHRLERERDNLTAAHGYALASATPESIGWALRTAVGIDATLQRHGPWALREPPLDAAIGEAERFADQGTLARALSEALIARSRVRCFRGSYEASAADAERALALACAAADGELVAWSEVSLGIVRALQRRTIEARELHERALTYARSSGEQFLEGLALGHLGSAHYLEGELDEALVHYRHSQEIFRRLDNVRMMGVTLDYCANVLLDQGRLNEAEELRSSALEFDRRAGNRTAEAEALGGLGEIAQERGKLDDARRWLEAAVSALSALGNRRWEGQWTSALGACLEERLEIEEARASYERALAAHREVSDMVHVGYTSCALVRLMADRDWLARAADLLDEVAKLERSDAGRDALFVSLLELSRGHVELARARKAERLGRSDEAEAYRSAAARRLDAVEAQATSDANPRASSTRARTGIRLLRRALDTRSVAGAAEHGPKHFAAESPDALVVGENAKWITPPGSGAIVLENRPSLQRLVQLLVERRALAPGETVSAEALVARGWPGERLKPQSARKRLHTALWTLRKMGLAHLLLTREDGYLLDPAVAIVRRPSI